MRVGATVSFLDALRQAGVLTAAQFEEAARLADAADAPGELARALAAKAWVTPFQAQHVARSRSRDLVLGPYVLMERVGEGGMGQVFRARHVRMGRDVALKVIRAERLAHPDAVKRFRREIMAAAQLHHPNIVAAYDAGEDGPTHFFAMEFVEGVDLARLVQQSGPLPVAAACDYARQAALALQHAHERGLVHRDVKPSNLLLVLPGAGSSGGPPAGTVKLLDLGLARLEAAPDGSALSAVTQEGLVLGTPDFLAPEQARDARLVDVRADLYALGGTLYYLLTGRVPYPGGTPTEKLVRHLTDPPPDLAAARPDVPAGVAAAVAKLLAKDPGGRFQTPDELAAALGPYCGPSAWAGAGSGTQPAVETVPSTRVRFKVEVPTTRQRLEAARGGAGLARRTALALAAGFGVVSAAVAAVLAVALQKPAEPAAPPPVVNAVGMEFVHVPGGRFVMGSPRDEPGHDRAEAEHEVVLAPFWLASREVTRGQYAAVTGGPPPGGDPDLPAVDVSWDDAAAFCRRLTERESSAGRAYRLPTEAQWEYACRAGAAAAYAFGQELTPEVACFAADGPRPVGSFGPNAWGLCDTHGNVAEWCADWYSPFTYGQAGGRALADPAGPAKPGHPPLRVARGGSWRTPAAACRSAARRGLAADGRSDDLGFRPVLTLSRGGT